MQAAIGRRISTLSSNYGGFQEASGKYNDALKSCGYKETINTIKNIGHEKEEKEQEKFCGSTHHIPPYKTI